MPKAGRVQEQVFAAVARSGLAHIEEDGFIRVQAPPVEGQNQTTEVLVRSSTHDNGSVVVMLLAPVVVGLPEDDEEILVKAHMMCNALNQDQMFGRWVYYPDEGRIVIEHELVGEDLDPSEILGAVVTVAHSADRWDDRIQKDLGAGTVFSPPDNEVVE